MMVVLRFPHLMLPDVGHHDGVAFRHPPDVVDHMRRIQMPIVGQIRMSRTAESPLRSEMCASHCDRSTSAIRGIQPWTTAPTSPEMAASTVTFLLTRPVRCRHGSSWRAARRFSGSRDTVVEPHAERDEEVGFLDRGVDPRLAVHAHHAEIQRVRCREQPMPSSVIATGTCVFSQMPEALPRHRRG